MCDKNALLNKISEIRRKEPWLIAEALKNRKRRPLFSGKDTIFIIACDHPARGLLRVGNNSEAMADRVDLLCRAMLALSHPGVDGILATADIIEDLAVLDALDNKLAFGSMNRGGLSGSTYEHDDRFTGYSAQAIYENGLDGGKMLLRLSLEDPATVRTLESCSKSINELAAYKLPAIIEVLPPTNSKNPTHDLTVAVSVASGLGITSAYTWLKLPLVENMDKVIKATTLPIVLLGGDPRENEQEIYPLWQRALRYPHVFGIVAGRTLLYPQDGNIENAIARAVDILEEKDVRIHED